MRTIYIFAVNDFYMERALSRSMLRLSGSYKGVPETSFATYDGVVARRLAHSFNQESILKLEKGQGLRSGEYYAILEYPDRDEYIGVWREVPKPQPGEDFTYWDGKYFQCR